MNLTFSPEQLTAIILGVIGLANTGLLVLNHRRVTQVEHQVNGARVAAVNAAQLAGQLQGRTARSAELGVPDELA